MINEKYAKKFCCEDITKIYGYTEAVADKKNMWHCHHCLGLAYTKEQLIEKGLYYNQPAEMLLFCTKSNHKKLHYITKPFSEKTKHKVSKTLTNNPETSRKVLQFTKDGMFVAEYPSIMEAKRLLGICNGHISQCCNGKRKTAGGYCWRLKEM